MSGTPAPAPAPEAEQLKKAIREWIHADNLVESFTAQANNARQARARHEAEALTLMKRLGYTEKTQLRVSGGTIQMATRRTPGDLTWGMLERELPAWATRTGIPAATASGLVGWLQTHRGTKEMDFLKLTPTPAPTPTSGPATAPKVRERKPV